MTSIIKSDNGLMRLLSLYSMDLDGLQTSLGLNLRVHGRGEDMGPRLSGGCLGLGASLGG